MLTQHTNIDTKTSKRTDKQLLQPILAFGPHLGGTAPDRDTRPCQQNLLTRESKQTKRLLNLPGLRISAMPFAVNTDKTPKQHNQMINQANEGLQMCAIASADENEIDGKI